MKTYEEQSSMVMYSPVVRTAVVAAMALCACATAARAQVDAIFDGLPPVIAYSGTLELDGRPYDSNAMGEQPQPVEFRFSIITAPEMGRELWTEEWTAANIEAGCPPVDVYHGAFAVELGRCVPLEREVFVANGPYLEVWVRQSGEVDWIPLQNPQRLTAAPFAVRATFADEMTVHAGLDVGGDAEVGGDLAVARDLAAEDASFDSLTVRGTSTLGDDVTVDADGRLHLRRSADLVGGDSVVALQIGEGNGLHLMMDNDEIGVYRGNGSAPLKVQESGGETRFGGPVHGAQDIRAGRDIVADDDVIVADDLTVRDDAVIEGDLTVRGRMGLQLSDEMLGPLQGTAHVGWPDEDRRFPVSRYICFLSRVSFLDGNLNRGVVNTCHLTEGDDGEWMISVETAFPNASCGVRCIGR